MTRKPPPENYAQGAQEGPCFVCELRTAGGVLDVTDEEHRELAARIRAAVKLGT